MKKEEKIFDEIRKKVIEQDMERKNEQEINDMREANIEALTELTSLSRKEVEKIADEVKKDYLINQRKRQRRITTVFILAAIAALILYLIFKPKPELKLRVIEDDFSDNKGEWAIISGYNYKRYFSNNQYVFETNKTEWCYWDNVDIVFPKNYDVEVSSTWLNGKYSSYGIGLHKSNTDYYAFLIRGDGSAGFGKIINKEWVINDTWKPDIARKGKNQSNIQRVEVRNGEYKYYVNSSLVRTGNIEMNLNNLALRCCDEQKVAFQSVRVYDTDKNKVIFEDNFSKPSEQWNVESDFTFETSYIGGKFILSSNYDNECNWSTSDKYFISDNCEIELNSTWLSGELANYGFMILTDNDNYYSFEFQNNGEARLVESRNDNYVYVQEYVKTPFDSDGIKSQTQKVLIKDGKLSYYLNNQLIKETFSNQSFPCFIALRMCGKQTVAFDKLSIRYYE